MDRTFRFAARWALGAMALYAAFQVNFWPPSEVTHELLVALGIGYKSLGVHPLWTCCAAKYGVNAATLSVLCGGVCIGLFATITLRFLGALAASVAVFAFALSPALLSSATRVDALAFDMGLLLGAVALVRRDARIAGAMALLAAFAVDVCGGGWRGILQLVASTLPMGVTLVASLLLGGVAWSALRLWATHRRLSRALLSLTGVVLSAEAFWTLWPAHRNAGALADRLAAYVLDEVPRECRWLATDAALEDAFLRQIALRKDGPIVVSVGRNLDECYLTNLAARVAKAHPDDLALREAASLSVRAFLEDLPRAETNRLAWVHVWDRTFWTQARQKDVRTRLKDALGNAHDPLTAYVKTRLAQFAAPPKRPDKNRLMQLKTERLAVLSNQWDRLAAHLIADLKTGSYAAIREDARMILRADRDNPLGNALLGALAMERGEDEVAELYLRRAVATGRVPELVRRDLEAVLRRKAKDSKPVH